MRYRKQREHMRRYRRGPKLINRGIHYHSIIRKNPVQSDLMEWEKEELARIKKAGMSEEAAAKFLDLWEDVPIAMKKLRISPEEEAAQIKEEQELEKMEKRILPVERPIGTLLPWKDLTMGRARLLYTRIGDELSGAKIEGNFIKIGDKRYNKDDYFSIIKERFNVNKVLPPKSFDDLVDRVEKRKDLMKISEFKEWGARKTEREKGYTSPYHSIDIKYLPERESLRKGFYQYPVIEITGLKKYNPTVEVLGFKGEGSVGGLKEGKDSVLIDVRKIKPIKIPSSRAHPTIARMETSIPKIIHANILKYMYTLKHEKPLVKKAWVKSIKPIKVPSKDHPSMMRIETSIPSLERKEYKEYSVPFKKFPYEYKGPFLGPKTFVKEEEKKLLLGGK